MTSLSCKPSVAEHVGSLAFTEQAVLLPIANLVMTPWPLLVSTLESKKTIDTKNSCINIVGDKLEE